MTAPEPRPDTRPWWAGIRPAELSVTCGGLEHRLRWHEGQLTAADHPDADRERALVALGGAHVACLDLLDAWTAHADDLDLLVLASRGPSDRLPEPEPAETIRYSGGYTQKSGFRGLNVSRLRSHSRAQRGWAMYGSSNAGWTSFSGDPEERGPGTAGTLLTSVSGALSERLIATVIATWTERIYDDDARVAAVIPKLQAALYGRVLATVRDAGIRSGSLDLVMVRADAPRSITARDGRIRCELPFGWLGEVWAKGFATVLGHLCLRVETVEDGRWRLLVVDRDLQGTHTMTIELTDG